IDPTKGPTGSQVTITGTHFSSTASEDIVKFGDKAVAKVVSATETELVVVVPADVPGQIGVEPGDVVPVSVTIAGQTAVGPDFTVIYPTPVIKSIDPVKGPVGTKVRILGANF